WQEAKARAGKAGAETVALGLVERRQRLVRRVVLQVRGEGVLHGRADREHHELVHAPQLLGECGRRTAVPHLPSGGMERLAEGRDDERPFGERWTPGEALVTPPV